MSVNLETKIKGSTLPKVEDVVAKLAKNSDVSSLTLGAQTMAPAIQEYQKQMDSVKNLTEEEQKTIMQAYIVGKSNELNKRKRAAMQEIAETKFSVILSKKWFVEFKSFDENKLSLTINNTPLDFTFDLTEKEVKI
jgi:predicted DNA binding protein